MDCVTVGNFIAYLRKEKQMTQKELARKLSITDKAVSKWERGISYPDSQSLVSLANILDVSVTELLSGKRIEFEDDIGNNEKIIEDSVEIFKKEKNVIKRKSRRVIIAVTVCCLIMAIGIFWASKQYKEIKEIECFLEEVCNDMFPWYEDALVVDASGQISLHEYVTLCSVLSRLDELFELNYVSAIDDLSYRDIQNLCTSIKSNAGKLHDLLKSSVTISDEYVLIDANEVERYNVLRGILQENFNGIKHVQEGIHAQYEKNIFVIAYQFLNERWIDLCYPDPMIINGELVF